MSSTYPPYGGVPAQRCQQCGAPLPADEAYCRACGAYTIPARTYSTTAPVNSASQSSQSPSSMVPGAPGPQTSYEGSQYGGQQWGQASALPAPNNFYGASSPRSNSNDYGMPQQSMYSPPLPSARFQSDTGNGLPPAARSSAPQPKRGPRVGLIIGIALLLILLVGGAISGYLYVKNQDHASKSLTTPTVAPSSTPSAKPLFNDPFEKNTNGWDLTGSPDGKFSVKLGQGSLVLEDDENTLFPEFVPSKIFDNFQLNVDAVLSKGVQDNGYGVYIRAASTQNGSIGSYYRFELYGDGTYAIFKGIVDSSGNSTSNQLVPFSNSSAIQKRGGLNHITIIAKGSSMTFIVNGTTLNTVSDSSYKSGSVALFVSNVKGVLAGAQATFSHLAIYPPPAA